MQFPYFFEMRNGSDKVRVDSLFNYVFEFNIQFDNGGTDQFTYNLEADETEKNRIVQSNYSRIQAVNHFNQKWIDDKHH